MVFGRLVRLALLAAVMTGNVVSRAEGPAVPAGRFEVALPSDIPAGEPRGRLFVFLASRASPEPRFGPNWFHPEPFFAIDVVDAKPGARWTIDNAADGYPGPLDKQPAGRHFAQAVLHQAFDSPFAGQGAGNRFSPVVEVQFAPESSESLQLLLSEKVEEQPFPTSDRFVEVVLRSELLSKFHGRDVYERAGVVLPASYATEPQRRYPVIFEIPGFGGNHRHAGRYLRSAKEGDDAETAVEFIAVMLSGQCHWGHHVYADSATNGPRGTALVEELIPHIDRHFRTIAAPTARFLTGVSSGGWSSLWLQVRHPDTFGGVWSLGPDPVDFRDYQQVDLYADPPWSLYRDEAGSRRPLARRGKEPVLWYEDFGRMDDVLKRGGQLRSFEAVFSPRGLDGEPLRLWDRVTGRIDPTVAKAWEQYDIRLVIERNWTSLRDQLAGKLHIYMGGLDTFYLDGAVRRLAESLRALGSDAEIVIDEDKDHASINSAAIRRQIREGMIDAFRRHHAEAAPAAGS